MNRFWEVVTKLACAAVIGLVATVIALAVRQAAVDTRLDQVEAQADRLAAAESKLEDHEVRLSVVKSNRFTDRNGDAMRANIMTEILRSFPPEWLREDIREIKVAVKEINQRLRALEVK